MIIVITSDQNGASSLEDINANFAFLEENSGALIPLTTNSPVNGSNTQFVFATLPNYIIADHVWYKETNSNGTTNWTWNPGTLTATLTIPPTEDVFGF